MQSRPACAAWLLLVFVSVSAAAERWTKSADGRVQVAPWPVDRQFRNADWPAAWEAEFWNRANHVIRNTARGGSYGNTFFENEKRSYGWAMLSVLGGFEKEGLNYLQSEDAMAQPWNKHTLGIDYYPCFTLKHQLRKYFYFGDHLAPEYRRRMRDAAKIFTEQDPLRRPHYAYTGKGEWGPDGKNSWVDVRDTDNLKLMRDTSVYLLAEETGNESTRLKYKQKLREFIVTMYYAGMGEWDSENYLGHSLAPLLNVYDFAKDPEVKLLAKAGLDWVTAGAAVKYWRGNYNGPSRRDYNHPYPLGGSAAAMMWLYFGDSPLQPKEFESDEVEVLTSSYRPPAAIVHLARKNFSRPAELLAGKPEWTAWKDPQAARPSFRETHYFGRQFQFGTLIQGSQEPDINGFKILAYSTARGADTIIAGPVRDPLKLGSVQYEKDVIAPHSAVGQNGNLAIYLTAQSEHPYLWLIPESATTEERGGVLLVKCEKTTLAIWPLNLSVPKLDPELTARVQYQDKKGKGDRVERQPRWATSKVLKAARQGGGVYGFAMEIDESDPGTFVQRASQLRPKDDELAQGRVELTAISGRCLRLQWGATLDAIKIWRDGQLRDWASPDENVAYRTLTGDLIDQSWQGDGQLRVTAGGARFRCQVSRDGKVQFSE